jgi:hypothetical protein
VCGAVVRLARVSYAALMSLVSRAPHRSRASFARVGLVGCALGLGSSGLGCAAPKAPPEAPKPEVVGAAPAKKPAKPAAEAIDWHSLGRCQMANTTTNEGTVLIVASDGDGYAIVLPPHPLVKIECNEAISGGNEGLVLKVVYPSVDTHLMLFSEPSPVLIGEKQTLESSVGRDQKALSTRLKATKLTSRVDGKPGAMLGVLTGLLPSPGGKPTPFTQWTTVRQRPSDKRLFTLKVTAGDPTSESVRMWDAILSAADNPLLEEGPGTEPTQGTAVPAPSTL